MNRFLSITLLVGALVSSAFAGDSVVRVTRANADHTPVVTSDVELTFTDFKGTLFGRGAQYVQIEAKNTLPNPVTFDPQQLSFVLPDGKQIDILGVAFVSDQTVPVRPLLVMPSARSKQAYWLNGRLDAHAKVFYRGQLVAEFD